MFTFHTHNIFYWPTTTAAFAILAMFVVFVPTFVGCDVSVVVLTVFVFCDASVAILTNRDAGTEYDEF